MAIAKQNDDIEMLMNFFEGNHKKEVYSDITCFSNFGKIYNWTNEEFELYPKENLENKSVLTITSSADHALDAVLNGATNIDSIDINVFCKYYSALKIAMIKKYDYYDFFRKINIFTSDQPGSAKFDTLEEISKYLSSIEIEFWNTYIKLKQEHWKGIFFRSIGGHRRNSYCSEEKYAELKNKLNDVTIKYYDGDIINFNNILMNKSYDCLYLSNVLERVETESQEQDRIEIIRKLTGIINNNAFIYNYHMAKNESAEDAYDWLSCWFEEEFDIKYYDADKKGLETNHGLLFMKKK